MTSAVLKPLSFEEFLRYDAPDDRSYELVEGQLVPMAEPIGKHEVVAAYLLIQFSLANEAEDLGYEVLQRVAVRVVGKKGAGSARKPDVVVMAADQYAEVADSEIGAEQPPPLVVEVVSSNWKDDYENKRAEYERTGIPEYWIVDYKAFAAKEHTGWPKQPTVTVYRLVEGNYELTRYRGDDPIVSPLFPNLKLTVNQIVRRANRVRQQPTQS